MAYTVTDVRSVSAAHPGTITTTTFIPLVMGHIIKVHGDYFVEFYGNGLRFRKKAGTTLAEAESALRAIDDSLTETELEFRTGEVPCDVFWMRCLEYARQVYPPATRHRFGAACVHCQGYLDTALGSSLVHAITPRVMEEYKHRLTAERHGHPATVNLTLYLVREAFEFGRARGWLNDNPLRHINFIPERQRPRPHVYSEGELCELREGLSEEADHILAMLLYAGLTVRELRELRWGSVNLQERFVEVGAGPSGDRTYRRIPLDFRLFELLRTRRADVPLEEPVFVDPQLPPEINPWWLRNTFAQMALARGVSLTQLNRLLGVADVARVFRYRVFLPAV